VAQLHTNPEMFLVEYRKFTDYLFHDAALSASATNVRPTYAFVHGSGRGGGYDPEAVVISTPKTR